MHVQLQLGITSRLRHHGHDRPNHARPDNASPNHARPDNACADNADPAYVAIFSCSMAVTAHCKTSVRC